MSSFNIKQAALVSQSLIRMFQIKLAVSATFSLILWLELYILLSQLNTRSLMSILCNVKLLKHTIMILSYKDDTQQETHVSLI